MYWPERPKRTAGVASQSRLPSADSDVSATLPSSSISAPPLRVQLADVVRVRVGEVARQDRAARAGEVVLERRPWRPTSRSCAARRSGRTSPGRCRRRACTSGGGLCCAGFGSVGKRAPPPADDQVGDAGARDERADERQPVAAVVDVRGRDDGDEEVDRHAPARSCWFDDCAGGGVKALTLNWRVMPETPNESGAAIVTALPGVVIPFQPLTLTRTPPSMSGTCESRCPGRAASTATSTDDRPAGAEAARQPELRGARRRPGSAARAASTAQ